MVSSHKTGSLFATRPWRAAVLFVEHAVQEVDDGIPRKPDLQTPDFVSQPWFHALYGSVFAWYESRHGERIHERSRTVAKGLVLIWRTPYELAVPLSVLGPGVPGKTAWLRFPDEVLAAESVQDWIVGSPDLSVGSKDESVPAIASAKEVATHLRQINVSLIGNKHSQNVQSGFLSGVRLHIETAATHVVQLSTSGGISRAIWELQMACESAFKALMQHRTGSIKESHDLFFLYDSLPDPKPTFGRDLLKQIPRWEKVTDLRYGQGQASSVDDFFRTYRVVLSVVNSLLQPMVSLRVGKATLEMAKPPWLPKDIDDRPALTRRCRRIDLRPTADRRTVRMRQHAQDPLCTVARLQRRRHDALLRACGFERRA